MTSAIYNSLYLQGLPMLLTISVFIGFIVQIPLQGSSSAIDVVVNDFIFIFCILMICVFLHIGIVYMENPNLSVLQRTFDMAALTFLMWLCLPMTRLLSMMTFPDFTVQTLALFLFMSCVCISFFYDIFVQKFNE